MTHEPLIVRLARCCALGQEVVLECHQSAYQGQLEMVWDRGCVIRETHQGGGVWAVDVDAIACLLVPR